MRTLFLTLALTFSVGAIANTTSNVSNRHETSPMPTPIDTKAAMKEMRLEFKLSERASSIEEMSQSVMKLESLIEYLKQEQYTPEKHDMYQEGFNKLSTAVELIKHDLDAGNLSKAKETLEEIDELRVEYHKKRNPSIWSKIFG